MQETLLIGSRPSIITKGQNPRINKDNLENIFLQKYIKILAELLLAKKELSNINIVYIGGYNETNNVNRAKLFISAFNYYLTNLGYDSLSKERLTIIDEKNIEENKAKIEQCDLLFLGVGTDSILAQNIDYLERKNIFLNKLVERKNILVLTICSGSVMVSKRIYGSKYDNYFANEKIFNYPKNLSSLSMSNISLEPSFQDDEEKKQGSLEFIENFLKPDSFKISFLACCPDSFFLTNELNTYLYGKSYLFIDGEMILICDDNQKVDITRLIQLINKYNDEKERNIINLNLKEQILKETQKLTPTPIIASFENFELDTINFFQKKEETKNNNLTLKNNLTKKELKRKINFLFSDESKKAFEKNSKLQNISSILSEDVIKSFYLEAENQNLELYLKMNLLSIVKKSFETYHGLFTDFKSMLYNLLEEYLTENPLVVYYFITICGSIYSNSELKKLLINLSFDNMKRPQAIINDTLSRRLIFK